MPRGAGSSLSFRLFLLVVLAIAPAFALVVYTASEQRAEAMRQAHEDAIRIGRSIAFEHQRWVNDIQRLLVGASQFTLVPNAERTVCDRFAETLVAENPVYNSFQVVSGEGEYLCAFHPPIGDRNPAEQAWFQRAVESRELAVGDYQVDSAGNATIVFAYPVLNGSGEEVSHVLALSVSLVWVGERAAEADLPPDSTVTLVDGNGTALSRYPDSGPWIGVSVADVPSIATALEHETQGTTSGVRGLEGEERLYGFVPFGLLSDDHPLRVIVGIPEQEAFQTVEGALRRNLLGLAAALFLGIGGAWLFGEAAVMRQVRVLVHGARRLAAGDFSTRVSQWRGSAELGQVASAFDQMAEALQEREAERARAEAQHLELARAQAARTVAEAGQQRLRALVDTSPVGVFVIEAGTGRTRLANREWRRVYAVAEAEEATAEHSARAVHRRPDGRVIPSEETPMMRALLKGETTRTEEVSIELPDGRTVPALISATPLLRPDGSIEGAVVVVQDTTRLAEVERLKSEFLGMVTHELRSPMVAIKSAVGLLRYEEPGPPSHARELLDAIDDEADRLLGLVGNLLDMAQIEAGAFSVFPQPVDLAEVVRRSVAHFTALGTVSVDLNVPEDLPRLGIDAERIGQVMDNLLANAARFSFPDSRVKVDLRKEENAVTVSVHNQGRPSRKTRCPCCSRNSEGPRETPSGAEPAQGWASPSAKVLLRPTAEPSGPKATSNARRPRSASVCRSARGPATAAGAGCHRRGCPAPSWAERPAKAGCPAPGGRR